MGNRSPKGPNTLHQLKFQLLDLDDFVSLAHNVTTLNNLFQNSKYHKVTAYNLELKFIFTPQAKLEELLKIMQIIEQARDRD